MAGVTAACCISCQPAGVGGLSATLGVIGSRGAFWVTFATTPILGPWMVMALMRWAGVSQRRVAPAILSSLTVTDIQLRGSRTQPNRLNQLPFVSNVPNVYWGLLG